MYHDGLDTGGRPAARGVAAAWPAVVPGIVRGVHEPQLARAVTIPGHLGGDIEVLPCGLPRLPDGGPLPRRPGRRVPEPGVRLWIERSVLTLRGGTAMLN
ncbi:hypothetical protein Amsp01_093080 [Amycolatopsis sp. NBRC 101858]|nr:hypothetical protein Amsp01_093080 [Amycolatopsis sp. NBRC 101858]